MYKKFFLFVFVLLSIFIFNVNVNDDKGVLFSSLEYTDESKTISDLIYQNMNLLNDSIYEKYSDKYNIIISDEHNYGALSLWNINQNDLKSWYNALGDKRINRDFFPIINDLDNIGLNGGICQPTAVSMALRYMVKKGFISYTPTVTTDQYDIYNVFYEVVKAYIDGDWGGSGAERTDCPNYINNFFQNNNIENYVANYIGLILSSSFLSLIEESYNNYLPVIGHLSLNDSGHAVTICGYITKCISFTNIDNDTSERVDVREHYAIVNDGWYSVQPQTGSFASSLYYENYSYVNIADFVGLTVILSEV